MMLKVEIQNTEKNNKREFSLHRLHRLENKNIENVNEIICLNCFKKIDLLFKYYVHAQ